MKTKLKNGIKNLYIMDAEQFELPTKFNTIVAGEVIEHLRNPGLFLASAYESLETNGILILTTPQPFGLLNHLYALLKFPKTCQNLEHSMWFCPQTIRTLTKRYNYVETEFNLIQDLEPDASSIPYTLFRMMIKVFGFLFPRLARNNTMLFVLAKTT